MTMGAGFMKDMIVSSRNNRSLLKGNKIGKYKSFDKSYISDSIISRKPLKFKTSTPGYLRSLKEKLNRQRQINILKGLLAGLITVSILGLAVFYLLIQTGA